MDTNDRIRKVEERLHRIENAPKAAALNLRDLADVDAKKIGDGQGLAYDKASGLWQGVDAGGGGGGGGLTLTASRAGLKIKMNPEALEVASGAYFDLWGAAWVRSEDPWEEGGTGPRAWASFTTDDGPSITILEDGIYEVISYVSTYTEGPSPAAGRAVSVTAYDLISDINANLASLGTFAIVFTGAPGQSGMDRPYDEAVEARWCKLEVGARLDMGRGVNYTDQTVFVRAQLHMQQIAKHNGAPLAPPATD